VENPPLKSSLSAESAIMPAIGNNARGGHMAHSDQSDGQEIGHYHSSDPAQLDLFGPSLAQCCDPDPESVRAELMEILARARAAPREPWPAKEASYWRTTFPQMANGLPAEEAQRLRLAFAAEMKRLAAA
jgi:hypothetical protein